MLDAKIDWICSQLSDSILDHRATDVGCQGLSGIGLTVQSGGVPAPAMTRLTLAIRNWNGST
ncbi:hypothetical protein ACPA9J_19210, partial [Pseudomonas aeruginosa]